MGGLAGATGGGGILPAGVVTTGRKGGATSEAVWLLTRGRDASERTAAGRLSTGAWVWAGSGGGRRARRASRPYLWRRGLASLRALPELRPGAVPRHRPFAGRGLLARPRSRTSGS